MNFQEDMYVIRHETIGIDGAEGWETIAMLVVLFQELLHVHEHLGMILEVFEDILAVDTTKHNMIYASA